MTTQTLRLLIVEDDDALREALIDTAEIAGLFAVGAADGTAALRQLEQQSFDLVISDIQMAPMDGHELLRNIRQRQRDLPVVLMTAYESTQSAIDALREGATDYLVKPFEAEVLIARIDGWLPTPEQTAGDVIAVDASSQRLLELVQRVATSDASVMITGESGVGKEVIFRAIHRYSERAQEQPVAINCAAIPDNMLEAALFGYEKGAFTGAHKACPGKFEQAQNSTLLLDEVSEMPLALQAKLLRVLQERQVERLGSNRLIDLDVRIVATSNRALKAEVEAGRFREDLYYRLNVMPLHVAALRERRDDIVPLAKFLLARTASKNAKTQPQLTGSAELALRDYHWPGNVRELDNVMQRALLLHQGAVIDRADLMFEAAPDVFVNNSSSFTAECAETPAESLGGDLKDHERHLILSALAEGQGSRKFAAEKLGISPRTLRYKIARMRDAGVAIPGR